MNNKGYFHLNPCFASTLPKLFGPLYEETKIAADFREQKVSPHIPISMCQTWHTQTIPYDSHEECLKTHRITVFPIFPGEANFLRGYAPLQTS